jgi:hypothetical protein
VLAYLRVDLSGCRDKQKVSRDRETVSKSETHLGAGLEHVLWRQLGVFLEEVDNVRIEVGQQLVRDRVELVLAV